MAQGRETDLCTVQSKWKGAVKGAETGFQEHWDKRLLEEKEEKSRGFAGWRNRAGREGGEKEPPSESE